MSYDNVVCCTPPLSLAGPRQELRETWASRPKGSRVNLCRFMGAVTVARERLPEWHLRSLECLYYGVVSGKLSAAKYKDIWGRSALENDAPKAADDGDGEKPTTRRDDSQLRKLRQICDNTLLVASLFYADEDNLMRQSVLVGVAHVAQEWQGMHNQRCRSVEGACEASVGWSSRTFLSSCSDSFGSLSRPELLVEMRFELVFHPRDLQGLSIDHPKVAQADEYAQLAGSLVVRLVAHRIRKFLDVLRGWPRWCALFASPDAQTRAAAMDLFRRDVLTYGSSMSEQPYPEVKAMRERSVFRLPAVQQYVELARAEGWRCSPRVQQFAQKANSRLLQTQVSEDGFNRLRTEEVRGRTKRVRDERAWKGCGPDIVARRFLVVPKGGHGAVARGCPKSSARAVHPTNGREVHAVTPSIEADGLLQNSCAPAYIAPGISISSPYRMCELSYRRSSASRLWSPRAFAGSLALL